MFRRLKKNVRQIRANRRDSQESSESGNSARDSSRRKQLRSRSPTSDQDLSMVTDYLVKVDELAAFDACVETSDAIAASSPYTTPSIKVDKNTGLKDCSVLVSPDGELLLLPNDCDATTPITGPQESKNETEETNKGTNESGGSKRDPRFDLGGELESAVCMGNDLKPGGDKAINGFSAMGWSPAAASLAIRQSEESIRSMASFVEDIMLIRKEGAARVSQACDKLRTIDTDFNDFSSNGSASAYSRRSSKNVEEKKTSMPFAPGRVGPLRFQGGTIQAATQALEQYHSLMSENDANRLRMASVSNLGSALTSESSNRNVSVGILPGLRRAAEKAAERSYSREKALREMQYRADTMDARLAKYKEEASSRWEAVHEAEEKVSRIVEERMLERSRERERRRMEQLRESYAEEENNTNLGATPNEIWDLVSAVAESMEGGSFEPTGLPDARISGPQKKSQQDTSQNKNGDGPRDSIDTDANDLEFVDPPFPLASRSDIEQECDLPVLRSAAMAADESIEDAAGSLLNILSTLDTTRRSARLAAETCLLSVANSQARSIRALIALERASIEDRLRNVEELERIAENIDVRKDLEQYIGSDKKERGGSTLLGEDDDGGVASALAVLSSHVEGSMGYVSSSKLSTEGWDEDYDEEYSAEKMEDAVELLFGSKTHHSDEGAQTEADFNAAVDMLCNVSSDPDSSRSRSLRSTICYAVNQKRSSNAELQGKKQFDALCRVFAAILSGCDREASGVANAKMCMMLSQTFYMVEGESEHKISKPLVSPTRVERNERVFVKSRLMKHELWNDEEFWDQALYQCVTESLTHSGVMANFERSSASGNQTTEWTEYKKLRWHDLTNKERAEAAAQVHAVVFAQLGALAHSMIEFGCGIERSCAFVRRMAIRNQLPISQRAMLLQHLMDRDCGNDDKTNHHE